MFSKRFLVVILGFLVFFAFGFSNYSSAQTTPKVSVKANKKSYNPGTSGVLTITFKTGSGVKIPKEPPIDINISGDGITGNGIQDYSGDGDGDYLSSNKVKYNFSVSDGASDGSITISGTVKFGYCSSESGVCKIGNQKFSIKIKVQ